MNRIAPVLFIALLGCSETSVCKKACNKLASCAGDSGAATTCPLEADCNVKAACQGACYNQASCEGITGQSASDQATLQSCLTACESLRLDKGVSLGDGGPRPEKIFFTPWDLGNPTDGVQVPDTNIITDLYFPTDLPPAGAVGKFCNDLVMGGNNFTATLKVGTGSSQATFKAYSGECSPKINLSCPAIPYGTNLTVEVFDGSLQSLGTATATILAGEEWGFVLTTDGIDIQLTGGPFKAGYKCATTDPLTPIP